MRGLLDCLNLSNSIDVQSSAERQVVLHARTDHVKLTVKILSMLQEIWFVSKTVSAYQIDVYHSLNQKSCLRKGAKAYNTTQTGVIWRKHVKFALMPIQLRVVIPICTNILVSWYLKKYSTSLLTAILVCDRAIQQPKPPIAVTPYTKAVVQDWYTSSLIYPQKNVSIT